MTGITSPSVQRRYPLTTIRRVWGMSRATLYRQRSAAANEPRPPARRGPPGAGGDADPLVAIREAIEGSPFTGEASQAVAQR